MDGYICDKGLFLSENKSGRKISEPLPVIENWMNTIIEYRSYANPNSPSWDEYLQAVFQIMGFTLQKVNQRIFELKNPSEIIPCAIVGSVHPGENFDYMIPGLSWSIFLNYAAKYHQVEWGVLFNGAEMQIFNFMRTDFQIINTTINFEKILAEKQILCFITFCKYFSIIRKDREKQISGFQKPTISEIEELLPELRVHQLQLTKREMQILNTIKIGKTNEELAESLELSSGVVRNYLSSIYKKLKVKSRTEAILKAKEIGLIND